MTPEEKAKELIYKFSTSLKVFDELDGWVIRLDSSKAKGHALTAVDEIIDILELNGFTLQEYHDKGTLEYWLLVKDEIQNS
jgi:hypothetical protein